MIFANVKGLRIPEGNVKKITDASGRVLWSVSSTPGGGGGDIDVNKYPTLLPNWQWRAWLGNVSDQVQSIEFVDSYTSGTMYSSWAIDEERTGSIMCYALDDYCSHLIIAGNGSGKIYANPDMCGFFGYGVKSETDYFDGLTNLNTIDGLDLLDTSRVVDMSNMFRNTYGLAGKYLNLSSFDTSNVVSMKSMFEDCGASIINLLSFDTTNVQSMRFMFDGCQALTLDLYNFNTPNLTDMYGMFCNCMNITSLDLTSFNTKKVSTMDFLFTGNEKLIYINVSKDNWDMSGATTTNMFGGCGTDHLTYV